MCGRFNLTASPEQVIEAFRLHRLPGYEISYNIPPGQKILTIVQLDDGSNKAVNLHWGLIPHWSKDSKISSHLMNARAETLTERPAFKSAYQQRCCLIPATGFYEWQQLKKGKQAHCIYREDHHLFAFAGLWDYWEHGTETIYSCAIITTSANALIEPIHQRMPVIIDNKNYDLWLGKNATQITRQSLLATDAYQKMVRKPISAWVNNPSHNDENCMR